MGAQLDIGRHQFIYRAQDLSGNSRICEFVVYVRELQCMNPIYIEHGSTRGNSTCDNAYGSVIDVICATGFKYQYECESDGLWRAKNNQYCPTTTPLPNPTTANYGIETTKTMAINSHRHNQTSINSHQASDIHLANNGVAAAVALVVIAILACVGFLLYRNRNKIRLFGNIFNSLLLRRVLYRRDDDAVQLNDAMQDSGGSFTSNDILTGRM